MLSTRDNMNNPIQLRFRNLADVQNSPYNPAKPTRVLIHGWWEDGDSDISVETSRQLLQHYDFNIILVDWSEGSRFITYLQARNRVGPVGIFLASYLDFLRDNNNLDYSRLTVIGFSLGGMWTRKKLSR